VFQGVIVILGGIALKLTNDQTKSTLPYQVAWDLIQKDPEVIQQLGGPLKV
jgi:hypothetical protein